jgi:hypothetical protein
LFNPHWASTSFAKKKVPDNTCYRELSGFTDH